MKVEALVTMSSNQITANNDTHLARRKCRNQMTEFEQKVPDLTYRTFMVQLSRQITSKDEESLKYLLTSVIPDGKMELLDTPLKLIRQLERIDYIGPNNFPGLMLLQHLFGVMGRKDLCDMIARFVVN